MVMESQLRNQLAASVRSINWSYALFWSISSTQPAPGILTWTDRFYNGEVKTTKIANSAKLTANQLIMRRSEQLRELYEALCSGKCDRRAARPVASLSPEDLGNTEWYYMVSMTYAFRPGQGLPGRSFASNERVWMGNAHLAHNKAFPRAILAQSTSIQTIVCIPLMGGVLELGATHEVVEDPDLIRRATAAFWGMQFPACSEEPSSSRLASERGKPAGDIIVFKEIDHIFMEAMIAGDEQELGEAESLSDASLEHITTEIDQFYSLCDVQALDDTWIMDGSFEVPSLPQQALGAAASATNNIAATSSAAVDGPRETCFTAWARPESDSDEAAVLVVEEPQKLLRKAVGGRAWAANNGGGSTTRTDEEGGIKNHILTERKRREKLNKMFLILKSLVPSIDKVDKASILAETIAYLKELQQRVQELESSREPMISHPSETTKATKRHDDDETVRMGSGSKRKGSELGSGVEREHPCVLSEDGSSTVTVTVSDKEVLVDVHCRWEELMMTRVFDAIKSLQLDILSVQASAPDGFMGLNIRAQLAGSAAVVPWMISEALREAIGKR